MGFFSGLIGSAIGGLSSLLGNSISGNKNASESRDYLKHSLGQQYGYWQKGTLSNWSLQRKSLEKAGYNPMLALSGGAANAFSPNSPSASGQFSPADIVGSSRQGAELVNDLLERIKNQNAKDRAEIDSIVDANSRANKTTSATIQNINADTQLKKSQNINTNKDTYLNNPLVAPVSGVLGGAASSKLGSLFGGSANSPTVKAWDAAARRGAILGIGSKLLRAISLPSLIASAGIAAWNASKQGSGKKLAEYKYFPHGNWSR